MLNTIPLIFTDAAADKVKNLIISKKNKNLKLRIYITGGGCSGFQYNFILDEKINKKDIVIKKFDVMLLIDSLSVQYLFGGTIDYVEDLSGSKFIVLNPNAKVTCSCGSSFNFF